MRNNNQRKERISRVKDCKCEVVEEPLTYCTPTGSNYPWLGSDHFSQRGSISTSIMVQPGRDRYKPSSLPLFQGKAQSSKWLGAGGHSASFPIRSGIRSAPQQPLVKGNQAHCRPANSEGIKAIMKFTAGLASPSNGPAQQWHRLLFTRM